MKSVEITFFSKITHKLKGLQNVYAKKTYSQCGEDIIIRHVFDILSTPQPNYLDIGAHHPYMNSNTALFYQCGSRGVLVEPDPVNCYYLRKYRKNDICIQAGISDNESEMDYFIFNSTTLNTFSESLSLRYQNIGFQLINKIRIKMMSPVSIFEKYFYDKAPDFISLDVEGMELQILKAMNLEKYTPKVICLETVDYSNDGRSEKNMSLIDFVKNKGYIVYADTGINTIFILEKAWKKSGN
jgi:FkbM family methyltransferase